MTSTVEHAPVDVATPTAPVATTGHRPRWIPVLIGLVVAAGLILRFTVVSHLWLDEALTVDIARLPLRRLPAALRHDGAPPLYYALLHLWMRVFGTGDVAVRALSGVFGVALLPAVYFAGRRLGGRRVAWAAVLIVASSPFANHYATEARMYSLVALLAVLSYLAAANGVERPTPGRLACVALVTSALLYTHYWSIYLLTAMGGWLLWRMWRAGDDVPRRSRVLVLAAMAVGAATFLPWVPSFLFQAAHTGTPWSEPADFGALVSVITEFSGGPDQWAQMLAFVLFSLALLGVFGKAVDRHRVELDLRTLPRSRGLLAVLIGTPALAVAAGLVSGTAFVARYTSVVFPVFCLLVALGVSAFADRRVAGVVLGLATVLGLWCSLTGALWTPRTQAGDIATAIRAQARPGDVVAFCPDQLGPAVDRLLPDGNGLQLVTYPRGAPPGLINWVDYGAAVEHSSVGDFAKNLVTSAGPGHDVWLVAGKGYRPFNGRCNTLVTDLGGLRQTGSVVVQSRPIHYFEHATLYRSPRLTGTALVPPRLRAAAPHLRAALPGWLVARVIVLTADIVGRSMLRHGYHPHIKVVLTRSGLMSWDADWYRRIAVHGYGGVPRSGLRFFPLYPFLGRALGYLLGGRVDWALLLIANGLALVLGALVHHLVLVERGDPAMARRAAWFTALAPPAFVLVMGYSEALFLCLVVVAFGGMRRGRWWWVACACFLAGLTRPVGLLLVVPVLVAVVRRRRTDRAPAARVAAIVSPVAGTAAYLAWVGIRFGDPQLPFRVQDIPGLRGGTVNPLVTVGRAVGHVATLHGGTQLHDPWVLAGLALTVVVLVHWPLEYGLFALVNVLAAAGAEHLGSFERYLYGGLLFVLAGVVLTRSSRVEKVVLTLSAATMGAYALAAFIGAYVP